MDLSKIVSVGIELYKLNKFKEALLMYKRALKLDMNIESKGILYYNIGLCHMSLFNYKAALVSFKKSFYDFNNKNCGYELCMCYLHEKDLKNGMNLYKYRYYGHRNMFPNLPINRSTKISELKGKKVLVLNEQGFGDEILFSRVINELSKEVISCDYQVYDKMLDLFNYKYNYNNINFFINRTLSYEYVNSFDTWISIGDIFSDYMLKSNDYLFKNNMNYNINDYENIGICWMANSESKSSYLRSIDIDKLKDKLENKNVLSLQYNRCEDWMKSVDISNFKKTFDIINSLDIVITVDTVTAHLSLLCNKKTILLHNDYIDWRWNFNFYNNLEIISLNNFLNKS